MRLLWAKLIFVFLLIPMIGTSYGRDTLPEKLPTQFQLSLTTVHMVLWSWKQTVMHYERLLQQNKDRPVKPEDLAIQYEFANQLLATDGEDVFYSVVNAENLFESEGLTLTPAQRQLFRMQVQNECKDLQLFLAQHEVFFYTHPRDPRSLPRLNMTHFSSPTRFGVFLLVKKQRLFRTGAGA